MLAMLAAAALATSQPVVPPHWERKPSGDDLMEAYPPAAASKDIEGRAIMVCTVDVYGDMDDCDVVSETPPGWGFGAAALRISLRLHMSPQLRNGVPEPSRVRIPIRFALPKETGPAPAPPKASQVSPQLPLPRTGAAWSLLMGGVLALTLLTAALGDLLVRGRRAPAPLGAVVSEAIGFWGRAWRGAPAALLCVILFNVAGDLTPLAPRIEAQGLVLLDLLIVVVVGLMATVAVCRVGLRDLRPHDPGLRPGPLSLRFGEAEMRLLAANLLAALVIVLGAGAATALVGLGVWGAGLAMDRWIDPVVGDTARQAIAAVGGDVAALAGVYVAAMVLIGARLTTLAPHVAFDPELDIGTAWRSSRGAWFAATIAEIGLWSLIALLAFILGIVGVLLSRLLPWGAAKDTIIARAGLDAVLTALIFPLRAGVALEIFRRVRRLQPGG